MLSKTRRNRICLGHLYLIIEVLPWIEFSWCNYNIRTVPLKCMVGLFTLRSDGSMELEKRMVCWLETYVAILSEILLSVVTHCALRPGPGSTVLIKMSRPRLLLHYLLLCWFRRKMPNSFVGSQCLETSLKLYAAVRRYYRRNHWNQVSAEINSPMGIYC